MRAVRKFVAWAVAVAAVAAGGGCEDETDKSLDNQRTSILRYLDGQGENYITDGDVYITVLGNRLPQWETPTPVEAGDSVRFMFAAYTFPVQGSALPFYTNILELAEKMQGLDTRYWSFDPVGVKVGTTPIISGLAVALPYCRYGDSVAVYMTSAMAYGDRDLGMVDRNTALKFVLEIEEVKKND